MYSVALAKAGILQKKFEVHSLRSFRHSIDRMSEQQTNRLQRKTKEKKKHTEDRNPKAFAFANPI
ncbi:hypothetical protein BGX38DRAFT_1191611 [Terfezia claveryi]|nr:hypothetical protein BGX38DRAFT_1191611 [Terfezia claveryi]